MAFLRRGAAYLSRLAKTKPDRIFVGQDLQGTCYYEIPQQTYWFGLSEARYQRLAEPQGVDLNEVKMLRVTPEWDSWLRGRRDDPPTLEELEMNVNKFNMMQEKISKLADKQQKESIAKETVKEKIEKDKKQEQQDVESWGSKS
uniref:NADH-ubiquinone oxidoreductase assembly factor N7BML-like n=1 Tax=Ciona intestinalis TaxID=7719 RepID=UPI0002B8DC28|nr:NADH-ubiquinone oxidoreductase assembly factor N7BML-like [Ciona intestinalis]|eukprot:XP_004226488.1 NADH-ubiquinone oxidoreductase assembly factor N7BML-like [Ciona intestinalis]